MSETSTTTITTSSSKPGYKTTEFWLSILALAMPLVEGLQHFPTPWVSLPAAAIAGAYALSRSQTKKADASVTAAAVAPSVLAAAADQAAKLQPFGAMTQAELDAARAANRGPPPPASK